MVNGGERHGGPGPEQREEFQAFAFLNNMAISVPDGPGNLDKGFAMFPGLSQSQRGPHSEPPVRGISGFF